MAGLTALVVVGVGAAPALAAPDAPRVPAAVTIDYPSWDDIAAAQQNEAAQRAEIARIEGILAQQQARAAQLAKEALTRQEQALQAQNAADAAAASAQRLAGQARAANDQAEASAARAAQILAQLARTGGGDVALSLMSASNGEVDALLARLGTMGRLSASSEGILRRAIYDRNTASALEDQADAARAERQQRADAAQRAYTEAQSASDAAAAEVADQQAHAEVLYAQLAQLKNTTAELERERAEGLAAEGAGSGSGGSGSGGGSTGGSSGGGNSGGSTGGDSGGSSGGGSGGDSWPTATDQAQIAGAIAYARAQLGEPYVYGGAGPNGWDCSGLTLMSYSSQGVYIGIHGSTSQYNYLASTGRLVRTSNWQAGDLLFYSDGGSTSGTKYHVAMYIGGGQMIEAPYAPLAVRIVGVRTYDLVPYVGRPTL
ncbi:MAG: C40 family peptidase [Actinomycetales bacterium]|nr:C40 family peptidase [Actinomycetales bacterium]